MWWVGGSCWLKIMQDETSQILSLAENPRWSRVWQYASKLNDKMCFTMGILVSPLKRLRYRAVPRMATWVVIFSVNL